MQGLRLAWTFAGGNLLRLATEKPNDLEDVVGDHSSESEQTVSDSLVGDEHRGACQQISHYFFGINHRSRFAIRSTFISDTFWASG